jgi:hypothetical protein
MGRSSVGVDVHPVRVTPPAGIAKQKAVVKLTEMARELEHIQMAISEIKRSIMTGDGRGLASGVMNSRNWCLSLVESHSYVQSIVYAGGKSVGAWPFLQAVALWHRAAELGVQRGEIDRG